MTTSMSISYDTIRDLRFALGKEDPFFPKVNLMWKAMTDWPAAAGSIGEFLDILHGEIPSDLTAENLKRLSQGHGISPNRPHISWIRESSWELALLIIRRQQH